MRRRTIVLLLLVALAAPTVLFAQTNPAPDANLLTPITDAFKQSADAVEKVMVGAAQRLFFLLMTVDFIYTGIEALLKNSGDGQSIIAIVVRRILFYGFFLWVLSDSQNLTQSIVNGFMQLGSQSVAAVAWQTPIGGIPVTGELRPSAIAELGLQASFAVINSSPYGIMNFGVAAAFGAMALAVLIAFAFVAVRMVLVLAEGYVLLSAGTILLGFGASRWTSEYAKNYLKYCVALGVKLMLIQVSVAIALGTLGHFIIYKSDHTIANMDYGQAAGLVMVLGIMVMVIWHVPSKAESLLHGHAGGGNGMEMMMMQNIATRAISAVESIARKSMENSKNNSGGNTNGNTNGNTPSGNTTSPSPSLTHTGNRTGGSGGGGGNAAATAATGAASAATKGMANGMAQPPGAGSP